MSLRLFAPNRVVLRGPSQAAAFLWKNSDGRDVLTVVCRLTFELSPRRSMLAAEQENVRTEDVYRGGDRRSELQAPSDLAPFKRRADILVTGHAYAPYGNSAPSLAARFVVGTVDKTIVVHAASGRAPLPPDAIGPIAPQQSERAQKLGLYAASWDDRDWHARPLPRDVDAAYFNSAPLDQQADRLAPDERIELENLHPDLPRLVTRLEPVTPRAALRRRGVDQPLTLRCDTLLIDTDRSVCSLVWRGSVPVDAADDVEVHVTVERDPSMTMDAMSAPWHDPARTDPSRAAFSPVEALSTDSRADVDVGATMTLDVGAALQRAPLPFSPAIAGSTSSFPERREGLVNRAPSPALGDPGATLLMPFAQPTSEMPFRSASAREATERAVEAPIPAKAAPAPPFFVPPPAMVGPIASAAESQPLSEKDIVTEKPAPPAMMGPLAAELPSAAARSEAAEPAEPAVDPGAPPIETWAEICAELDKAARPRAEILATFERTELAYKAIDEHWRGALEREAATGGYALRFKYDAAYVGALERLRERPLSAAEYARILAAGGHRQVAAVLALLEMPAAAHLPIVRRWTTKLARDPKLSMEMSQSVTALREGAGRPDATSS